MHDILIKMCLLIKTLLSRKWWVMEQFPYHIWIKQRQICKRHLSFLQGEGGLLLTIVIRDYIYALSRYCSLEQTEN